MAIPNEVRREMWSESYQLEVRQEPILHLLQEGALGWDCGIPGLPVPIPPQPPEPAYAGSGRNVLCAGIGFGGTPAVGAVRANPVLNYGGDALVL